MTDDLHDSIQARRDPAGEPRAVDASGGGGGLGAGGGNPVSPASTGTSSSSSPGASPSAAAGPSPAAAAPPPVLFERRGWERTLDQAFGAGASDLVFAAGQVPLVHIQGFWQPLSGTRVVEAGRLRGWAEDLAGEEHQRALTGGEDGVFVRPWWSGERRVRVVVRPETGGLTLALRLIPAEAPPLATLGAPPVLQSVLSGGGGLVLIGGGGATGRSTLLAAAVEHLNGTEPRRIAYLGTPPEFAFAAKQSTVFSIDPREGGRDVRQCLHSLRFHDADTVAIDTVLAGDDLYEALLLAQAGVLVLLLESGTALRNILHGMIERLSPPRRRVAQEILAESLRAAIVQALVKRSDGQGRIAVHEICLQSRPLGDPLREGRWDAVPKVMSTARQLGMRLLDDSLDEYVRQNWITGQEAFQHALDKTRFLQFGPPEWQSAGP